VNDTLKPSFSSLHWSPSKPVGTNLRRLSLSRRCDSQSSLPSLYDSPGILGTSPPFAPLLGKRVFFFPPSKFRTVSWVGFFFGGKADSIVLPPSTRLGYLSEHFSPSPAPAPSPQKRVEGDQLPPAAITT